MKGGEGRGGEGKGKKENKLEEKTRRGKEKNKKWMLDSILNLKIIAPSTISSSNPQCVSIMPERLLQACLVVKLTKF